MPGIGAGEGAQGGSGQVIDVYEAAILPVRCPLEFRILVTLLPDPLDRLVGPRGRRADADGGYAGAPVEGAV